MENNKFFSKNPPLTVFEDKQIRLGLNIFLRPKDYAIFKYLDKLKFKKAKNILDFGCANGTWLERILNTNKKSKGMGVDISTSLVDYANDRPSKRGIYFNSSKKWPIKANYADFCFSFDVLEHLRDRKKALKPVYKSIKKGGILLFFTLNPNNKYTFDWLFEIFGSDWLYKRSDHLKSRFVSPQDLSLELARAGFTDIGYQLYPGPANLFWDVFCYIYLGFFEKFLKIDSDKILFKNSSFVKFIYKFNQKIDKFFLKKGYSNGYFIWAKKK